MFYNILYQIMSTENYTSSEEKDFKVKEEDEQEKEMNDCISNDLLNQLDNNEISENKEKSDKMLTNFDFNMNPFNEDDGQSDSSGEDYRFVESNIQNNFFPENIPKPDELEANFNFEEEKLRKDAKPFKPSQRKLSEEGKDFPKRGGLHLSNPKLPKIPSYPLQLSQLTNLGNNYGFHDFNQNNQNISHNASTSNFQGIMFPNNSFTMNGKNGWVCRSCGNFNYEMRMMCNRCGRAQMPYRSPSIQSANCYSNKNKFSSVAPIPFTSSHGDLQGLIMNEYDDSNKKKDDKKKKKPFVEREGDWICFKCKNLNFAFRTNCNRCHLTKAENQKIIQSCMNSNNNFSNFTISNEN